jgi:hypothetical protein
MLNKQFESKMWGETRDKIKEEKKLKIGIYIKTY